MNGDARVNIRIVYGPLPDVAEAIPPRGDSAANAPGAVVTFEGVVRPGEGDGVIEALEYEVYQPMTERELRSLARAVCQEHGVLTLRAEHSVGRVAVGEVSFRLRVTAAHRREAIDAMDDFITRMKRDVPIWKNPVWRDGGEVHDRTP